MLKPLLLIIILNTIKSKAHTPRNFTDVIVTYEGHAEAIAKPIKTKDKSDIVKDKNEPAPVTERPRSDDEVVFVPNEKPEVERQGHVRDDADGYLDNSGGVRLKDVFEHKSLNDIVHGKAVVEDTEATPDIVFISGKNNDNVEEDKHYSRQNHEEARRADDLFVREREKDKKAERLDCSKLDCNNTIQSFCGGKVEHKRWRYRLFKNECFFKKVNCAFSYPENRYTAVPIEECRNIGSHNKQIPYYNHDEHMSPSMPITYRKREKSQQGKRNNTRRFVSSRRSLTVRVDGEICSHPCPSSCSDDYEPQCAVSTTGHKKVFVNHCKLDYNSCSYRIVWHVRPLTDCVGHRKADLHQNRAFVGWMQKVGIVDKKGKLVLS